MGLDQNPRILHTQKGVEIGSIYYLDIVSEKNTFRFVNGPIIIKYYGLNIQWMEKNV